MHRKMIIPAKVEMSTHSLTEFYLRYPQFMWTHTYIFVLHKNLHFYTCDDFVPQQILPDIDINLFFIDETTSYMNLPNNTTSKKYLITYSFLMTVILYRDRL